MSDIKISVVVPIYNTSRYLSQCIESLIKQTLKDIEIILIDDGSTDNSKHIYEKYRKEKNIKIFRKENSGLSDTRNYGIDKSSGKYIVFIDSDDWCELDMLEKMYDVAEQHNLDLVVTGASLEFDNNSGNKKVGFEEKKICKSYDDIRAAITIIENKEVFNIVWNKLYRLSTIKMNKLKFKKEGVPGEDLIFNSDYFKQIESLGILPGEYYHYRKNNTSITSGYKYDLINKIKYFDEARISLYEYYKLDTIDDKVNFSREYIDYRQSVIRNIYKSKKKMNFKSKVENIKVVFLDTRESNTLSNFEKQNIYDKIFCCLLNINSPIIAVLVYDILFYLRNNMRMLYTIFRNKELGFK